jgi:3-dehydroquinate dehydratase-1
MDKICVSIAEPDVESCLKAIKDGKLELAEIRLDRMKLDSDWNDVKRIFSQSTRLIATCRPDGTIDGEQKRKQVLLAAVNAGAAYVDVELEAGDDYKKELVGAAKAKGCKVIVSYHDYKKTPSAAELEQIVDWCFKSGADIAKVACKANSAKDCARLLGLIDNERDVIAIGMGKTGVVTRVLAPILGSPFTYAALEKGKETAEGQITKKELETARKMFVELMNVDGGYGEDD